MNLQEAVKQIDKVLGIGYANRNPELLGLYLVSNALHEIDKTLVETANNMSKFKLF